MRYTREQWKAFVEEQKQSGKSCAAFCRERGIDDKRFLYYRRSFATSEGKAFTALAPVLAERVEIDVGDDLTLRVPVSQLRTVLDVLCG